MGFAAPLVTQIACEALFPGLPVWVIAQRLGSEERCLATRAEQKVRKDRPRPEKKLLDVATRYVEIIILRYPIEMFGVGCQIVQLMQPPDSSNSASRQGAFGV